MDIHCIYLLNYLRYFFLPLLKKKNGKGDLVANKALLEDTLIAHFIGFLLTSAEISYIQLYLRYNLFVCLFLFSFFFFYQILCSTLFVYACVQSSYAIISCLIWLKWKALRLYGLHTMEIIVIVRMCNLRSLWRSPSNNANQNIHLVFVIFYNSFSL